MLFDDVLRSCAQVSSNSDLFILCNAIFSHDARLSNPFFCELCVVIFVNHLQESAAPGLNSASQTIDHAFDYLHELNVLPARIARIAAAASPRYLVVPPCTSPGSTPFPVFILWANSIIKQVSIDVADK